MWGGRETFPWEAGLQLTGNISVPSHVSKVLQGRKLRCAGDNRRRGIRRLTDRMITPGHESVLPLSPATRKGLQFNIVGGKGK